MKYFQLKGKSSGSKRPGLGLLGRILVGVTLLSTANAVLSEQSLQRPVMESKLVSHILLTDSVHRGERFFAPGLYGNIISSADGINWEQSNSPTQSLLTTIFFIDDNEAWVGGHDTLILHTTDGGKNWQIQYEDPITGGDIPKPVLDIVFKDKNNGYAIGAYGLMLITNDGGANWNTVDTTGLYDLLESKEMEPEPNFNSMVLYQGKVLIAGELGTILVFDDTAEGDERWQIVDSPYTGSFFGAKELDSGELFIYGLRGNVYRSSDGLQSWDKIDTGTIANIFDCFEMADGTLIFTGASGTILRMDKAAMAMEKMPYPHFDSLMSIQTIRDGELLLFGSSGVKTISLR
ncbi:MAG: hypothetical protein KBT88_02240 [Gammaproteobacteria bacterium]|nr:hypothetical protein [Gammaproteobacteria bacterium]MBQ0838579.1 hypothetical protein [Gammaproteobacteria bacterium]